MSHRFARPLAVSIAVAVGLATGTASADRTVKEEQYSSEPLPPNPPNLSPPQPQTPPKPIQDPDQVKEPRPEEPERPLRFGGDLGVVSLPRLVSVDLLVRYKQFAGGLAFEYLPPGFAKFGDKTTLSWLQLAAQARYFVWKPIFVGVLAGYQFARADSEKFGSEIDYVSHGAFVGARAGVLFTLKNGIALGGDLGLTVPIKPPLSQNPEDIDDSNARKAARTFGEFVMPQVSLFRVGFFY